MGHSIRGIMNTNVSNQEEIQGLLERIAVLEEAVTRIGQQTKAVRKRAFVSKRQMQVTLGVQKALCVDTIDPWKENRVRFYHPLLHDPDTTCLQLPFAKPISCFGGFDDCGVNWVPPGGSTLVLLYEQGNRASPYYIGTTWHRDRGPGGSKLGFKDNREWEMVWKGHRKGYLVGANDESQVFAPWNTESYNGRDIEELKDFSEDIDEQKRITWPHIYGIKTPEKHAIKFVDGNPKCNRRWKRLEIFSGCGNYMIFKDDHLHESGQWGNPKGNCSPGGGDVSVCSEHQVDGSTNWEEGILKGPYFTDPKGKPIEREDECQGQVSEPRIMQGHPSTPSFPPSPPTKYNKTNKGSNPYFKHQNECRPICGPGTPQNNKLDLPQSGIQLLSISGHTIVCDDSVEEPRGKPEWERSLQPFDFGCNDKYLGVMYLKSATGHGLVFSDVEEDTKVRGYRNFVELKSAGGNRLHMNDDTIPYSNPNKQCPDCPPFKAGPYRGIWMESTSEHAIIMNDYLNCHVPVCRKEGAVPKNDSPHAVMIMRSGYGHELRFEDHPKSQRETKKQWLQLTNPQCARYPADPGCNRTKGPHFLKMIAHEEAGEDGPGLVFLRCGGHHIRQTTDLDIVLVGSKKHPNSKFTYVSNRYFDSVDDIHFRYSGKQHIFFAEEKILLMAGRDCPPATGPNYDEEILHLQSNPCCTPCLYSVIVSRCPVICPLTGILHWTEKAMSERVFASAMYPCGTSCGSGGPECGSGSIDIEGTTTTDVQTPPTGTNVGAHVGMQKNGGGAFAGFPKID